MLSMVRGLFFQKIPRTDKLLFFSKHPTSLVSLRCLNFSTVCSGYLLSYRGPTIFQEVIGERCFRELRSRDSDENSTIPTIFLFPESPIFPMRIPRILDTGQIGYENRRFFHYLVTRTA